MQTHVTAAQRLWQFKREHVAVHPKLELFLKLVVQPYFSINQTPLHK